MNVCMEKGNKVLENGMKNTHWEREQHSQDKMLRARIGFIFESPRRSSPEIE